ncbi:hypothetical protein NM688_g547 [Phlebia brevispora]|uniref:Uncharacterized protein n=1 Tax=Phlebia brevispora TaxID=194682 RepID=A0ACC1TEU2_9APHY|nr:hypothetical protein NM688_g547 [Phlebia brevispora]
MAVLRLRGRFVDLERPSLSFYGPVSIKWDCETGDYTLVDAGEWFQGSETSIRSKRCEEYVGGATLYSGRVLIVREAAHAPFAPISVRKDAAAGITAGQTVTQSTQAVAIDFNERTWA